MFEVVFAQSQVCEPFAIYTRLGHKKVPLSGILESVVSVSSVLVVEVCRDEQQHPLKMLGQQVGKRVWFHWECVIMSYTISQDESPCVPGGTCEQANSGGDTTDILQQGVCMCACVHVHVHVRYIQCRVCDSCVHVAILCMHAKCTNTSYCLVCSQ